jgi:hypothetical protein
MAVKALSDGLVEVSVNTTNRNNARYGAYILALLWGAKHKICGFTTRVTVKADVAIRVGLTTRIEVETARLAAQLEAVC